MSTVLANAVTANAPHWFAYTCIAVGISAYLAVGLISLVSRSRRTRPARRTHAATPRLADRRVITRPTVAVAPGPTRKEVWS